MADFSFDDFQEAVSECLIRHRSVLDVMTKFQEASSRVNRAMAKSVTACGCMHVNASKQRFPEDPSFTDPKLTVSSHIEGEICPECKEVLETEIGQALFYLVGLCTLTDVDFGDIMNREWERLRMLGMFNMR